MNADKHPKPWRVEAFEPMDVYNKNRRENYGRYDIKDAKDQQVVSYEGGAGRDMNPTAARLLAETVARTLGGMK